ncbi:uncharacterized protein LOC143315908 [Chaetodon auriga]|uniref:uncharacterized protein LOC143315908 n=1 Tax=Chaetodon auriga TaxID=39042 RepID=UPI0040329D00
MGKTVYILNHYLTGVILFGDREQVARHGLSKVNFGSYQGIISFVNIDNTHWKFVYINTVTQTVYLVDPSASSREEADSNLAAKKFSQYLKMRRIRYGKTDWVDLKWKGGVMTHPTQRDSSSCGVIVVMMARAVMERFPALPVFSFETSKKAIASEREEMGLQILKSSVFDVASNCALCSMAKPPGTGPDVTNWIQCDSCQRWFHEQCLGMDTKDLEKAKNESWDCLLCV